MNTSEKDAEESLEEQSGDNANNDNANANANDLEVANANENELQATNEEVTDANANGTNEVPELGDIIKILGGRLNNMSGRIYYRDEELIRVLPENVSDRLIDITIEDGEISTELGIDEIVITYKRTVYSFVELFDLRVNSPVETYDKNGKLLGKYTIQSINENLDSAVLIDEVGSDNNIIFDFYGIPLDAPFAVMRVLDPLEKSVDEGAKLEEFVEDSAETEEIEFEKPEEIKEVPVYQRIYPDVIQKTDFLQDIVSYLDSADKRNPKNIIKIRNHIELFIRMRNEIINYRADGNSANQKPASVKTLEEVVKLQSVPLMRPILDVKRILYYDIDIDDESAEIPNLDQVILKNFNDNAAESEEYVRQFFGDSSVTASNALPNFYAFLSSYMDKFNRNWVSGGTEFSFQTDSEFFRRIIPYQDEEEFEPLSGYDNVIEYKPDARPPKLLTSESITNSLKASMLRGLGPTERKLNGKPAPYINAERASVINYLLFPYERSGPFSVKRSGSLLYDIETSGQPFKSIKAVFETTELGEEPTPSSIMLIGAKGTTLGNISLEEYFKNITLAGFGISDFLPLLRSLGLTNKELTLGQQEIFTDAIKKTIGAVKTLLGEKREELGESVEVPAEEQVVDGFKERLDKIFLEEPLLKMDYLHFKSIMPQYENYDLAIFIYLLGRQPDLLESALGGQSFGTGIKRLKAVRAKYLEQLRDAQARVIADKMRGVPPAPNKCQHVKALKAIRKVPDNNERLPLLVRFVAKYQGNRKEQWINCRVCKEHLLCGHELLQIMQYSKPREAAILQKELLLNFGGGQFQGKYQCRNCGQSLGELEFDTNLEYDDDGRPMMGRAAITQDDVLADAIDFVLSGGPNPNLPDIVYTEENKKIIYNVAKQIAQLVGIDIEEVGFRNIVERANANISRLDSRQDYIKKGYKIKYEPYLNTSLICITACAILLEIQTRIPDYIVRYTIPGCVASFTGWPLGEISDKASVEYFACGIASITRSELPWVETIYIRQSLGKKKDIIITLITRYMETMILEPTPQQLLEEKRSYYKKLYGATSIKASDIIPRGFLPAQVVLSVEEEAAAPVISNVSPSAASRIWIRESHRLAKSTALLVAGSPFTETGCCFVNLNKPSSFWREQDQLPELKQKYSGGINSTHVALQFKERIKEAQPADLEQYLELFVRICFRGERVGYPHELNMLHKCDWCDFEFPKDPNILTLEETVAVFSSQEVDTSLEAYQTLLDETRKNNRIRIEELPKLPEIGEMFLDLGRLEPPPFEGWAPVLGEILTAIRRLPRDAPKIEVAAAYGPLSERVGEAERFLQEKLGEKSMDILVRITKLAPYALKQVVLSYIIIPIKRILTQYESKHLQLQDYQTKDRNLLNSYHIEDINNMLSKHSNFLNKYKDALNSTFIHAKITLFLEQIHNFINMETTLRESSIPGGELGIQYFIKAMIVCPLAELLDPHNIPKTYTEEQSAASALSDSLRGPLRIVLHSLALFKKESLSYSPEQIKLAIETRSEKEKMGIILEMDAMSKEEKQMILMQKKLGIGRWAVGGTNAIWKYNADRYEIERDERAKAGIIDFNTGLDAPAEIHQAGEGLDAWMGVSGKEDGYDVGQTAEDDY